MVNLGKEEGLEISLNREVEDKNALSLDKARELLKDGTINDIELENVIDSVSIFCRISYELFSKTEDELKQVA